MYQVVLCEAFKNMNGKQLTEFSANETMICEAFEDCFSLLGFGSYTVLFGLLHSADSSQQPRYEIFIVYPTQEPYFFIFKYRKMLFYFLFTLK